LQQGLPKSIEERVLVLGRTDRHDDGAAEVDYNLELKGNK
jgi:hypothetical protein